MRIERMQSRTWSRWLGVVLIAATIAAGAGQAAAKSAGARGGASEDFTWSGTIERGKTLEITGINGGIHAERASGGQVELRAVKTARRGDPASVRIEVTPGPDGVSVCAMYPGMTSCGHRHTHHDSDDDRDDVVVDFTVKVPAGVKLVASTVNGDVEVLDLDSRVEAESVNGSVELSTRGDAEASSVNGSVTARVGSARWEGVLQFKSVNGAVKVELPADLHATLDAHTMNGSIDSDFPVTVQGTLGQHSMSGSIGGGGGTLRLSTVNGDVTVSRAAH